MYWIHVVIGMIAIIINIATGTAPYMWIISLALGGYVGLSLSLATD